MTAVSLFDYMARSTDPDTSHEAAAESKAGAELVVLSAVRAAGWVGANRDDIHKAINGRYDVSSISRRLTSLERAGLVEVIGKRTAASGKAQRVYRSVGHLMGLSA